MDDAAILRAFEVMGERVSRLEQQGACPPHHFVQLRKWLPDGGLIEWGLMFCVRCGEKREL